MKAKLLCIWVLASMILNSGCGDVVNASNIIPITTEGTSVEETSITEGTESESSSEENVSESDEDIGRKYQMFEVEHINNISKMFMNKAIMNKDLDSYVISGYSINETFGQLLPYATGSAESLLCELTGDVLVEDDKFKTANMFLVDEKIDLVTKDTANLIIRDLSDVSIVPFVNDFASENTNGCIPTIIDEPLNSACAVLNAAYFKGEWAIPFDVANTSVGTFYTEEKEEVEKEFMNNTDHYKYNGSDMIELEYKDSNFVMDIIKDVDTSEMSTRFEKYINELETMTFTTDKKVCLKLPKFEIKSDIDVAEVLKENGYADLFGNVPCFDKLAENLSLAKAIQKAMVKVDEQGTEAAAVTMATLKCTAVLPEEPPIDFIVDHSFMYVIRDTDTNAIIFAGFVRK